jgi:hypothetical protein
MATLWSAREWARESEIGWSEVGSEVESEVELVLESIESDLVWEAE